jgi:hypothetical protein
LHNRRYSLAISYIKSVVQGEAFDNQVMNVRVSEQGFYIQSKNFPAAFYGDMVEVKAEFVSEEDARAMVFEAFALYRAGDARSLTVVYNQGQPADVFFGYRINEDECYEMGQKRSSLPLHLRVMVEAADVTEVLGTPYGALIYQRTSDGRHLILKSPRSSELLMTSIPDAPSKPAKSSSKRKQPSPLLHGFFE